jgi:hypothetical protein
LPAAAALPPCIPSHGALQASRETTTAAQNPTIAKNFFPQNPGRDNGRSCLFHSGENSFVAKYIVEPEKPKEKIF